MANYKTTDGLINFTCQHSIEALTKEMGFRKCDKGAISILTNLTLKLMGKVCHQTQRWSDHAGGRDATLDDLLLGLEDNKIFEKDIRRFMMYSKPIEPPINLPLFPVEAPSQIEESRITDEENAIRLQNEIPSFLPPIWPIVSKTDEDNSTTSSKIEEVDNAVKIRSFKPLIQPISKPKAGCDQVQDCNEDNFLEFLPWTTKPSSAVVDFMRRSVPEQQEIQNESTFGGAEIDMDVDINELSASVFAKNKSVNELDTTTFSPEPCYFLPPPPVPPQLNLADHMDEESMMSIEDSKENLKKDESMKKKKVSPKKKLESSSKRKNESTKQKKAESKGKKKSSGKIGSSSPIIKPKAKPHVHHFRPLASTWNNYKIPKKNDGDGASSNVIPTSTLFSNGYQSPINSDVSFPENQSRSQCPFTPSSNVVIHSPLSFKKVATFPSNFKTPQASNSNSNNFAAPSGRPRPYSKSQTSKKKKPSLGPRCELLPSNGTSIKMIIRLPKKV